MAQSHQRRSAFLTLPTMNADLHLEPIGYQWMCRHFQVNPMPYHVESYVGKTGRKSREEGGRLIEIYPQGHDHSRGAGLARRSAASCLRHESDWRMSLYFPGPEEESEGEVNGLMPHKQNHGSAVICGWSCMG